MKLTSAEFISYSRGNPGALPFLTQLDKENPKHRVILNTLNEAPDIRGSVLYVLWSDLADKSLDTVYNLCRNVPIDILTDACSREDYSGRELIKPFILPNNT